MGFKSHIIKSPFMNKIECSSICGYSSVLGDLKNNILKELTKDIFNQYKNYEIYKILLSKIEMIR